MFYSADQLAEGVQIRQPVRLDLGGRSLYFEGSIPPELGLLHLARLLQMSGMPAVSASMDGAEVFPIPEARLPGPAEDGGTAAGGELLLRFPDPQRAIRVVRGGTVEEFLLDLVGKVLDVPEYLQKLGGLLPIENGSGPGVRRHVLARTPFHKDGTPFRAPLEVRHARAGVLYLEAHLSREAAIDGARVLLDRFGIQAATGDIPTDGPRPLPATQPSPPPS